MIFRTLFQTIGLTKDTNMTDESCARRREAAQPNAREKAVDNSTTEPGSAPPEGKTTEPAPPKPSAEDAAVAPAETTPQPAPVPPEQNESTPAGDAVQPHTPPPVEATAVPQGDQLETVIREIQDRLASLDNLVAQRLQRDELKERMFDEFYDELQGYRKGAFRQANSRLLKALLVFHDNLRAALDNAEDDVASELQFVMDDFLGVLYSEDVEPIPAEVNQVFDGRLHKAVQRVPTANKAEDKTIERVARVGFSWGEKVLRPAEVCIRRFQEDATGPSDAESPPAAEEKSSESGPTEG
jgi:molecular chaperone GrpE